MKFWTDGTRFFLGVGAICVTLGVGTCSTNARIGDVNARIGDVSARIGDVNARIGDVNANVNARLDAVQVDIRDLRALIIDSLKRPEPAD